MNKMKKLFVVAFVVSVIAMLGGCLSEEQKEEAKEYEKQAKKNAVEYVEERYGIEAEVIEASYNRTGMFADAVSSHVDVTMEYDGKTFGVYIAGNKAWKDIDEKYKKYTSDNYQYTTIYNDLKEYVAKETKLDMEEFSIWYNSAESTKLDYLTNQYYDGDLDAFLEEQYVNVVVVTTDKALGNFDTIDMHDGSMYVYSYEKEYYKEHGHNVESYNKYLSALWMNWSVDICYNKKEITEYKKQKFGLGYLVYAKECDVNVNDTNVDVNGWEDSGFDRAKVVSDAYKINGTKEDVYIYVKSKDDDECIGISYEKNGELRYGKVVGMHQGEYLIGDINMKQYDGEVTVVILED